MSIFRFVLEMFMLMLKQCSHWAPEMRIINETNLPHPVSGYSQGNSLRMWLHSLLCQKPDILILGSHIVSTLIWLD